MMLTSLDAQLRLARSASKIPDLSDKAWQCLATTIYDEIVALDEPVIDQLRNNMCIPPERYREEICAFNQWMDFAHANAANPFIVRAQVMTELYVAFVWLGDSVLKPLAACLSDEQPVFKAVVRFLGEEHLRGLRNAVAHGRWCYRPSFDGLDCWDGKQFTVTQADLNAWQLLSRGAAIAAIWGLTDGHT